MTIFKNIYLIRFDYQLLSRIRPFVKTWKMLIMSVFHNVPCVPPEKVERLGNRYSFSAGADHLSSAGSAAGICVQFISNLK